MGRIVFQEMSYPCTRTCIESAPMSVQISILVDYDLSFGFNKFLNILKWVSSIFIHKF